MLRFFFLLDLFFINPGTSMLELFTPYSPYVLNLRPNEYDQIHMMANYMITRQKVFRFSLLCFDYKIVSPISDVLLYYFDVNLVSFAVYNESITNDIAMHNAIANISSGYPQAVFVWGTTGTEQIMSSFINQFSNDSTISYLLPYFIDIYNVAPNRVIVNTTLAPNNSSQQQQQTFSKNFNEGYFTGQYIIDAFFENNCNEIDENSSITTVTLNTGMINRPDYMRSVYATPMVLVDDLQNNTLTLGPIINQCDNLFFARCSNALVHYLYIAQAPNYYDSWLGQYSSVSGLLDLLENGQSVSAQPLIQIGNIYDPNDPTGKQIANGIQLAFDSINEKGRFYNAKKLQLLSYPVTRYQVKSGGTTVTYTDYERPLLQLINEGVFTLAGTTSALSAQYYGFVTGTNNVTKYNGNYTSMVWIDPATGEMRYRLPFRSNVINIRSSAYDKISTIYQYMFAKYYLNSTARSAGELDFYNNSVEALSQPIKGSNGVIRVGMYMQNSTALLDSPAAIQVQMDIILRFMNLSSSYHGPKFVYKWTIWDYDFDLLDSYKNKMDTNIGGIGVEPGMNGAEVDYIIISSTEQPTIYTPRMRDVVNYQLQKYSSTPELVLLVGISGTLNETSRLLYNLTGQLPSTVQYFVENGANTKSYFLTDVILYSDYVNNSILQGEPISEQGLAGFATGLFIGQTLANINGQIDQKSILSSIYSGSTYSVDGVSIGPFNIYEKASGNCNQGAKSSFMGVYTYQNTLENLFNTSWTSCGNAWLFQRQLGALLASLNNSDPIVTTQNNNDTSIIVGSVIGGVFLLCCLLLLIAFVILFLIFVRSDVYRKKKFIRKEPNYFNLAIKTKYTDSRKIEANYIKSTPQHTSTSEMKQSLSRLEKWLLNPVNAYLTIHCLTKSGIARDDVAAGIIYIYSTRESNIISLFKYAIKVEITNAKDEANLFREDSALASLWINYCKLVGLKYLWGILAEALFDIQIVSQKSSLSSAGLVRKGSLLEADTYEIDPNRLEAKITNSDDHIVNILHLKLAAQTIFNRIKSAHFPTKLSVVLSLIRDKVNSKYPELTSGLVANFVFLRFICLAITSSHSYGLTNSQPYSQTLRFLVLMSKILQNLGFGVGFEKERYMLDMNDWIKHNKKTMEQWLEKVGNRPEFEELTEWQGVEVGDLIKQNATKWMWNNIKENRQVVRREMRKKLEPEKWESSERELEDMGLLANGGSTSSVTKTGESSSERTGNSSEATRSSDQPKEKNKMPSRSPDFYDSSTDPFGGDTTDVTEESSEGL